MHDSCVNLSTVSLTFTQFITGSRLGKMETIGKRIGFRHLIQLLTVFVVGGFFDVAIGEAVSYHTYGEIVEYMEQLQADNPDIAKVYNIGFSVEGRQILAIKISDNPAVDEDEAGILFVGGHHASEWISNEVPYYLAGYLVENYDEDSYIRALIDDSEIWIVPLLNPDGYVYSRDPDGDRLWRKNRRDNGDGTFGVDINRNYSYHWGEEPGSSGDTSSWQYRGPESFSEPETRALRDLILNNDFQILLTYHNYGQLISYPWGYTDEPSPDEALLNTMAHEMSDLIKAVHGTHYEVVEDAATQHHYVSGDLKDWAYGTRGVLPFTIELRPKDVNSGGHVLPEDEILPTFQETLPAALYLIENAISMTDPPDPCIDFGGDSDADSICDDVDNCPSVSNPGQEDSDEDGLGDACDFCPNDADKIDPGVCGCGIADEDTDGDGVLDCNENCPNDASKTQPGICGCGIPDIDSDSDGVLDCVENRGPNGGDGNRDTIPDSQQPNIATLETIGGESYATLESPEGTVFINCQCVENPSPDDTPLNTDFPYGFFQFTIDGVTPGAKILLLLTLHDGAVSDSYYKYGPTPANPTDHWYPFLYDGNTGATMSENTITMHFINGDRGDDDLNAFNALIVDVGGPSASSAMAQSQKNHTPAPSASNNGGGGGCFIATTSQD